MRTALGLRLAVLVATRGLVRVDGVPAQCALRRRPGVACVDTVPGAAALGRRTGFVPALVRPASTVFGVTLDVFGVTLDVFGRPTSAVFGRAGFVAAAPALGAAAAFGWETAAPARAVAAVRLRAALEAGRRAATGATGPDRARAALGAAVAAGRARP